MSLTIPVARMPHAEDIELPAYATPGSAGMDLQAALNDELTIQPGTHAHIPTGIAIALPTGYEAQVRPRSGLAARHGVTVLNAPGTIDSDYRGEIGVLLVNLGPNAHIVRRADRIAQLVVAPIQEAAWWPVAEVSGPDPERGDAERGAGGFGSTD